MMNGLMFKNEERNRAWRKQAAALVLTLLVGFLGTMTARAQGHGAGGGGGAGKVILHDISFTASVGVARGQLVRVSFRIPTDQAQGAPNGKVFAATSTGLFMNVFDAVTGAKIKSFEVRSPKPGIHTFDIGGSGDDILFGGPNVERTRVQLRVEFDWLVHLDRPINETFPDVFPPNLQVVEKDSGRTTVHVALVKTGPGTVLLTNPNSY